MSKYCSYIFSRSQRIILSVFLWSMTILPSQGVIYKQDPIFHQDKFTRFVHFTSLDGLSNNLVLDILQDRYGQMWFATKNGLTRFDGSRYTVYTSNPDVPHSLSDNLITSLAEDCNGELWIGTTNGLNKYDRSNDRFISYKAIKDSLNGLQNNHIKALFADKEGRVWIECDKGYLSSLNVKTKTWSHFSHPSYKVEGEYYYHHIYKDSKETLWVGGRLTPITRIPLTHVPSPEYPILNANETYFDPGCFVETTDGILLCSDYEGNLGCYNPQTGYFNTILRLSTASTCAIRDEEGKIWVGGEAGGIACLDFQENKHVLYQNIQQNPNSLLSNNVYCLYKDKDGNIWIGTDKGVSLYPTRLNKIRLYQHIPSQDGLSDNHVTALMQDKDQVIWVGTENNGVDTFSIETEKFGNLTYDLLTQNISRKTFEREKQTLEQYFSHEVIRSGNPRFTKLPEDYDTFRSAPLKFARLNENKVSALYEDKAGKIYIGLWSHVGFNVYDKKQETLKRYALWSKRPDFLYPYLLECNPFGANWYNGFLEDRQSRFWCATWEGVGLNLFDRQKGAFSGKHYMRQAYPHSTNGIIKGIYFDKKRNRLYMAGEKYYGYYDLTHHRFTRYGEILPRDYPNREFLGSYFEYMQTELIDMPIHGRCKNIYYDGQDHVWISLLNSVICHTLTTNQTQLVLQTTENDCFHMSPTPDGKVLYISTHSTLYRINTADKQAQRLSPENGKTPTPKLQAIKTLFADYQQRLWIGTDDGILLYYPETGQIEPILPELSQINVITGTPNGDHFIGSSTGLTCLKDTRITTEFPFSNPANKGLPGMSIQHINTQQAGILWVSTDNGLVELNLANHQTNVYEHNERSVNSLPHNLVSYTYYDPASLSLWVATAEGISVMNLKTHKITDLSTPDNTSLSSRLTSCILEDTAGNIWIGTTDKGLNVLQPATETIKHFRFQADDTVSLCHNNVYCLLEDSQKRIWVGTEKGMCRYVPENDKFEPVKALVNRIVHHIEEDTNGFLWVTTDQGLYCLEKNATLFRIFHKHHGFQGDDYNTSCRLSNGMIAVGGNYGLNLFDPSLLTKPEPSPSLIFSNFKVEDSLRIADVNEREQIRLSPQDNSFSVDFSAADYIYGKQLRYRYRLEGFDHNYTTTQYPHLNAKYTNIPPGDYTFRLEVSNSYREWDGTARLLPIHIATPWYRQTWFITLFILFLTTSIILYIRYREHELKQRQLNLEKLVSERTLALTEALDSKNKFFSIISHDLRNPVQSIHSAVHALYERYPILDENERLGIIHAIDKSSKSTSDLLENLLIWVLSQREILLPNKQPVELSPFLQSVIQTLQPEAEKKGVRLTATISSEVFVHTDSNMLSTICRNLLSNAIKFSYKNGEVSLSIRESASKQKIEILVEDQGVGIAEDAVPHLFQPGFKIRSQGTCREKGSGIGLIIVHELISKMNEHIYVKSQAGKGSIFIFTVEKYTKK